MKLFKIISAVLLLLSLLCGCTLPAKETTPPPPQGDGLTVHFIDVGQADCALLECDGKYVLIDGGNVADSSLVVSHLQK
jgi:competence protein ComEC